MGLWVKRMPVDKLANMEEKLWILEDLNMMYIRQIALSLQVTLFISRFVSSVCCASTSCLCTDQGVRVTDLSDFS